MPALLADQGYNLYRNQVQVIVRDWPGRIALMQQASVSAYDVVALLDAYRGIMANLDLWSAIPGIKSYAQMITANTGYDPVTEYTNLRAAIVTAINDIAALMPQPGGFCAYETMVATPNLATTGQRSPRMFTSAQAAQVATDAQAVLNTLSTTP